ncbi:MAG: hypothetical protein GY716_17060 [bacterium]|nr:hypothetical protein [bacterium]
MTKMKDDDLKNITGAGDGAPIDDLKPAGDSPSGGGGISGGGGSKGGGGSGPSQTPDSDVPAPGTDDVIDFGR